MLARFPSAMTVLVFRAALTGGDRKFRRFGQRAITLTPVPKPLASRLDWIDWMRGLACLLMFQTHCYDSWLGGDARKGTFLMYSQLLGTLPAPLFLFLAGVSFSLITGKLLRNNASAGEVTRQLLRRGGEVFAFALLFRLFEFLIALGWAPWTDLFRVDILNVIGMAMMLMALSCGAAVRLARQSGERLWLLMTSLLGAIVIALSTPLLWTTWRPSWLPWELESYINGVNKAGASQPYLFPIFPWAGFAFAGLACGFILFSDSARERAVLALSVTGITGVGMIAVGRWLDHLPVQIYAAYDYWHTSPNFFLLRVGLLLTIAFVSFAWCRWGRGAEGMKFIIPLGQASLLVYWVHLELVYGKFSILPKRVNNIATATLGLVAIFLMMLGLALLRTRVDWGRYLKPKANAPSF
jgi:uncharacterized membrane protein